MSVAMGLSRSCCARRSALTAYGVASLVVTFVVGACSAPAEPANLRALGRVQVDDLNEISGVVMSRRQRGILWLHDDGKIRDVYAVRTSGELVARLRLPDKLTDVEDIAIGPGADPHQDYLYLGDFGDNDQSRASVRVVRLAEPSIDELSDHTINASQAETFTMTYPAGARDAEALFIEPSSGDVVIFTKDSPATEVFRAPQRQLVHGANIRLVPMCRVGVAKVSAADISPDGLRVVLRREELGWLWKRTADQDLTAMFTQAPSPIVVRGDKQGKNGEAISLHPSGSAYVTVSEGKNEWIYAFRIITP